MKGVKIITMQSLILTYFMRVFAIIAHVFRRSRIYKLLNAIYAAFSHAWANSVIVGIFTADNNKNEFEKQSAVYKILNLPFAFFTLLRDHAGGWLGRQIEKSYAVHIGRSALHNMMAINTRFFGIMMLGVIISYTACKFALSDKGVGVITLTACIAAVVLCLFNVNVMGALDTSFIARFVQKALGFDVHFDFFKRSYTQGAARLVLAAIIGLGMGALAMVSPILALALPCGIFGLTVVLYYPAAGVFFAVFAAPFVPTMALAGLCLLTLGSLVIKSITTPYFKWKFDGMGMGILGLLILFLISSLTSFAPAKSVQVWFMYAVFMCFYFVIINTVRTKKQLHGLLKLFVIAGALVSVYGFMQYIFGWTTNNLWIDETMFETDAMRVYSTLENPNVLGEYLLLVLPVAAVFMCKYKLRELPKWIYGLFTALLLGCLILTQSRGCWLGLALSAAVFVTFTNGRWWALAPIVLAILPFALPPSIINRLLSIGNMADTSTSYRVFIWFGTIAMLRDFWLGGIGMGEAAFNSVYPFYSYSAIAAPHSHNLYLQLISESGICALALFIAVMIVFLRKMTIVHRRGENTSFNSMMSTAIISGLLGFLLQSMFDYTFYNYRVMAMFFMFLAMGMALKYITDADERKAV